MSYTSNPRYAKKGVATSMEPSAGAKRIDVQVLDAVANPVTTIAGNAPTSRVYTRDYSKTTQPYSPNNQDYVTAVLGKNPFRI